MYMSNSSIRHAYKSEKRESLTKVSWRIRDVTHTHASLGQIFSTYFRKEILYKNRCISVSFIYFLKKGKSHCTSVSRFSDFTGKFLLGSRLSLFLLSNRSTFSLAHTISTFILPLELSLHHLKDNFHLYVYMPSATISMSRYNHFSCIFATCSANPYKFALFFSFSSF